MELHTMNQDAAKYLVEIKPDTWRNTCFKNLSLLSRYNIITSNGVELVNNMEAQSIETVGNIQLDNVDGPMPRVHFGQLLQ